jgi:hypothetical protein
MSGLPQSNWDDWSPRLRNPFTGVGWDGIWSGTVEKELKSISVDMNFG